MLSNPQPGHEDRRAVVKRRLVTVPRQIALWLGLTVLAPLLIPIAVLVDGVRFSIRRKPFMTIRLLAFAWVFLTADVVGVAWLFAAWVGTFGGRWRSRLVANAWRVQRIWAFTLLGAVRRLFDLRFEIEGAETARPGPVIAMFRHASIIDNLLPTALLGDVDGLRLRWIIKQELLAIPGLDVCGGRLPNLFVDRRAPDPRATLRRIRELGENLGPHEGVLIYPEGTRFTPERRKRAIAAMAERQPDLAARAAGMNRVMPPHIGGATALLDTGADVLVCAHEGLDGFAKPADVWSGSLVGRTIAVKLWRIPAKDIPTSRKERTEWLYDVWAEIDRWIGDRQRPEPTTTATSA